MIYNICNSPHTDIAKRKQAETVSHQQNGHQFVYVNKDRDDC